MKKKQRLGKIEHEILRILSNREYVEYSLRLLASKIKGINRTNIEYNSVRNAINRLEKHGMIESKVVPIYGATGFYFTRGVPSKLKMVRLFNPYRKWDCGDGIRFLNNYQLVSSQSNCKV